MRNNGWIFEKDGCHFDLAIGFEIELAATTDFFIVADFESTGPDVEVDEMLEFSAILVDAAGSVVSEFSMLVSIIQPVPKFILEETEITQKDVDCEGHPLDEVMKAFLNFVGTYPVFIHHAPFDKPFLIKVVAQTQQSFTNVIYDTFPIAIKAWPTFDVRNFDRLVKHVGAASPQRTLDFAKITLAVLLAAREKAKRKSFERRTSTATFFNC